MALHSLSFVKFSSLCRALVPLCKSVSHGTTAQFTLKYSFFVHRDSMFHRKWSLNLASQRNGVSTRVRRSLMVQATNSQRWTLDDVERISRGKASKAKTGSRAVPHRLQAGERTEFDLAKKKGYLVQRAMSRKYPLVNTYRNFCDASTRICIFIQQGHSGSDIVVLDLTPLRLADDALSKLTEQVIKVVEKSLQNTSQDSYQDSDDSSLEKAVQSEDDGEPLIQTDDLQEDGESDVLTPVILRFTTGRSEAKSVCQAVWNFWQSNTSIPLVDQTSVD